MAAEENPPQHSTALLELKNIQKWFGGVHALRGIDLTLLPGHAYHLLGENGCGKSTVIKIISGAHPPTSGEIILGGKTFAALTPIQSLAAGIETVYQDLSLLPNLTVAENVTVLFVTHKLDECYRIGGHAIVFRDGQCVAQGPIESYSKNELAELMTGRSIDAQRYRRGKPGGDELMKVEGLEAAGVRDVTLSLKRGEILGITGLADSGRNELAMALTGVAPARSGLVVLDGKTISLRSPADAIAHGIGYVPEDRLAEGLFLDKSILENEIALIVSRLSNSFGVVDRAEGRKVAARISEEMRLNTKDLDLPVGSLSGGNQQRVLIGRWLSIQPKLLVLHGPTVGVDVGSKDTIYRVIQTLSEAGMGLIIVSDDLPELLQNADRILVMNSGRIVAEMDADLATEEQLYRAMLSNTTENVQ